MRVIKLLIWPMMFWLVSACDVDELDFDVSLPEYTPELAIPLGYVEYAFSDIVEDLDSEDVILEEQPDRTLIFIYRDSTEFMTSADFIDIRTVTNSETILPEVDVTNNTNSAIEVPFTENFTFEFNPTEDEDLDSIFFSGGTFILEISSRFQSDLRYRVVVQETRSIATNEPAVFESSLTYRNIVPIVARSSQELAGLKTILKRGETANIFNVDFEGTLIVQPGQAVRSNDFLTFSLTFRNPEFDLVYGRFGRKEVTIEDSSIEFDFFEELGSQGFEFANAQMRFQFDNGYGIPIGLDMSQMSVITLDGDSIPLEGEIAEEYQLIEGAPLSPPGSITSSEVIVRPSNSNVSAMVNATPRQFNLNLSAISNPFDTLQTNFFSEASKITARFELNIPMDIKVRDLTQTLDYKLDGIDFDEADSLFLRFFTINTLPVGATFDIEIVNSDDVVVQRQQDVIFAEAPRFGAVGLVGGATTSSSEVGLGSEAIAALEGGIRINITARINSSGIENEQFVTILSTSSVELQVALRGKFRIDL